MGSIRGPRSLRCVGVICGLDEQLQDEIRGLQAAGVHVGFLQYLADNLSQVFLAVGRTADAIEALSYGEAHIPVDYHDRRQALIERALEQLTALSGRCQYAERIATLEMRLSKRKRVSRRGSRSELQQSLAHLHLLNAVWQGVLRFAAAELEGYEPAGELFYPAAETPETESDS